VTFPAIPAMQRASSLDSGAEAAEWRGAPLRRSAPEVSGQLVPLRPFPLTRLPSLSIEQVILARRSTRHYDTQNPISFEALSTLLQYSSRGFAADAGVGWQTEGASNSCQTTSSRWLNCIPPAPVFYGVTH
jgi:hypothetical protein